MAWRILRPALWKVAHHSANCLVSPPSISPRISRKSKPARNLFSSSRRKALLPLRRGKRCCNCQISRTVVVWRRGIAIRLTTSSKMRLLASVMASNSLRSSDSIKRSARSIIGYHSMAANIKAGLMRRSSSTRMSVASSTKSNICSVFEL
ncbi:Uncharacterised protein [Vibrio cholerae]|nr:Uncharacterised protein [Vibrio cholerae]CSD16077.1 Uncharacterised protein [Vibrio cholerae]